jgi:hypothetical protein
LYSHRFNEKIAMQQFRPSFGKKGFQRGNFYIFIAGMEEAV